MCAQNKRCLRLQHIPMSPKKKLDEIWLVRCTVPHLDGEATFRRGRPGPSDVHAENAITSVHFRVKGTDEDTNLSP